MEISEMGDELNRLIIYDGTCRFCLACVRWVQQHDRRKKFRFLDYYQTESEISGRIIQKGPKPFDSVIFVNDKVHYYRSDAVLKIISHLDWPWRALVVFRLVPRFIRDAVYNRIAAGRNCLTPKQAAVKG